MGVLYNRQKADVCPAQLVAEMNEDGGPGDCEWIISENNLDLTLSFADALTPAEETDMDARIAAHVCADTEGEGEGPNGIDGLEPWHEEVVFGNKDNAGDRFLNHINQSPSEESSFRMLRAGRVVHVRADDNNGGGEVYTLRLVKNASSGGAGTYKGGTVVGSPIVKLPALTGVSEQNRDDFVFAAGDRVSVHVERTPDYIVDGAVRLYVRYDEA